MSTRRARIKAVTSLPPRRKNNDGADNTKAKLYEKEATEKPTKSPRTPRGIVKNKDRNSPKPQTPKASPLSSPRFANNIVKNQKETVPSPVVVSEETKDIGRPKRSEKVSVITSLYSVKSDVFVSPKSVGSPLRKPTSASPLRKSTLSPLINTSRADINIQRLTPVTPEQSKQKNVESKTSDIAKNNGKPKDIEQGPVNINVTSDSRSDVPDDYNVPSVPESITEDTVMDGIVPLQAESSAPKPIALLKNEIISENAEVLFDPIVPLPSPSKVRPKLRPVPRLAPLRRNSVQGSASESEDENRRALLSGGGGTLASSRQRHDSHTSHSTMHSLPHREVNRIRNDSICSSVSQATTQPPVASSPVKEKTMSKARRQDMSRRMAAMRRRRETVKREALTMYDLIFYNPSSNPIVPDQDELNAQQANEKEEAVRKAAAEADKDEAPPPETDAAPVPQIKLGPNGEIMLDEQSLVIKQSETRKVSSGAVHEGAWGAWGGGAGGGGAGGGGGGARGRYRRTPRTAEWSDAETVRFYRALAALGTDFMLMERLFPGRTRRDLKLKFKKEERVNMAQVDKALRTSSKWDAARLLEEFESERSEAQQRARSEADELRRRTTEHRQRMRSAREMRVRMSRGSKALESSIFPAANAKSNMGGLTADELIQQHYEAKAKTVRTRNTKPKTSKSKSSPHPQSTSATNPDFVTPTRIPSTLVSQEKGANNPDAPTILKLDPTNSQGDIPDEKQPHSPTPTVPANIENGSLVVLTVTDPKSPSKKMLQTYIASGGGKLTPVALPTSFLNSVVTYMKKGTPKSNMSAGSSPHLTSPSSVTSQDSRACSTPGVIQMNTSPAKRQRHSSYTITQI